MAQLNTKIVLRNDSTANWLTHEDAILLKGEVGVEFISDGSAKIKIGDGTTSWKDLGYVGGEDREANVLEVIPTAGQSHQDAINAAAAGKTLNVGDVAYVKEAIYIDSTDETKSKYSYTGYVYNGTAWAAMDGNYSADNIYFDDDMMVTTDIGYIKTTAGSGTIPSAGKNLTQVFEAMFVQEKEPTVTDPSVTFATVTSGSKEVGTSVSPAYTANFSAGSYEFGPATGVQLKPNDSTDTGWVVTAKNGSATVATKTTATGTFDSIVVSDDTDYKITAVAYHTAGATPKTNKGGDSTKTAAIAEGSKTRTSASVTGYRSFFYGAVNKDPAELTSADIRALTNGGNYNGAKTIEIRANGAQDVKAFVIAIVGTNTRKGVTHVDSTAGMTVDVTGQYSLSSTIKPMVADTRGTNSDGTLNNGKEYKLWVWQPASVDSGAIHKITLG